MVGSRTDSCQISKQKLSYLAGCGMEWLDLLNLLWYAVAWGLYTAASRSEGKCENALLSINRHEYNETDVTKTRG